jgi:hypothetical protein
MSEHDTKAHSTFGGSIADRWMNCAGSTALVASVPPRASTSYASEGTAAHALAEYALAGNSFTVSDFVGIDFDYDDHGETKTITVTKDMADAVNVYLDAVHAELTLAKDAELYVEQRFVLPIATAEPGEVFGANDAIVYIPSLRKLTIFDYKHGAGVSVSAEDNAQLKFYAAGALLTNDWPVAEIELVIVQPRTRDADDNDGGVKRWALPVAEVIEFAGEAEAAIKWAKKFVGFWDKPIDSRCAEDSMEDTDGKRLAFTPGKWCRWCDAAGVCPAKERQALAASTLDFNDITLVAPRSLPDVKSFDTARLGQVLVAIEIIEEWGKQVRAQVDDLLTQGVPVPGWKLVDKIGRRKWIDDETKIAGHLSVMFGIDEDDSRPRKLVTITEAERLIKASVTDKDARKKALDETSLAFTLKESSGLTLVRESDKREGVDAIARDFGSINLTL